jgi:arsenate reductase
MITITVEHVDPLAIKAMSEIGIDISSAKPKSISAAVAQFPEGHVSLAVSLCGEASDGACVVFPGAEVKRHWPFDDPPHLARTCSDDPMLAYRRVRDEIAHFVRTELQSWVSQLA